MLNIDYSMFSSSVVKPIATYKELLESQLAPVIAVSKHTKEKREGIINQKKTLIIF